MIVRKGRVGWTELFLLYSLGSIWPKIYTKCLFSATVGLIAALINDDRIREHSDMTYAFPPFAILGIAISLYLGFRNDSCYNRWWDARQALGRQLVAIRQLGRILISIGVEIKDCERIMKLCCAHCNALKYQLRSTELTLPIYNKVEVTEKIISKVTPFCNDKDKEYISKSNNPADAILRLAAKELKVISSTIKSIDSIILIGLNDQLDNLSNVQTICECINSTPLPHAYNLLVVRSTFLYIMLVPFAIAQDFGYYTILFNTIVAYTFFGLNELSRQLEDPFTNAPFSLPLTYLCRQVEILTAEFCEYSDVPLEIEPQTTGLLM